MIYVGVLPPETAAETAADFIADNSLAADDVILFAEEEDGIVGYTALALENKGAMPPVLRIKAAKFNTDDTLEMLLRAAFSYGERRYADEVTVSFSEPADVLARLGFRQIDGQLKSRINNVVHMCRKCEDEDN